MAKKKIRNKYDIVVIGAGLSGLLIAKKMSNKFENVLLIDNNDIPGGNCKIYKNEYGIWENSLNFIPNSIESQKELNFLNEDFHLKLSLEEDEISPVTLVDKNIIPFMGLGEKKVPSYYDNIVYYLNSNRIKYNIPSYQLVEAIFNNYQGSFLPRSFLTQIVFENNKVNHIICNGERKIYADNFIYCIPLSILPDFVPSELKSERIFQKILKNKGWFLLSIDMFHSQQVTDNEAIHIISFEENKKEQINLWVGNFYNATKRNDTFIQHSHWFTYVENNYDIENQIVLEKLKKLKKKIAKYYPNALNNILHERIVYSPYSYMEKQLKLKDEYKLPLAENFWIISNYSPQEQNLLGIMKKAKRFSDSFYNQLGIFS